MSQPIAFFISFTCYGSWLHGDDRGSVDLAHNIFSTPVLPPDSRTGIGELARARLSQPPFALDESDRELVRDAFVSVCQKKGWKPWAVHVRAKHVHVVVTASRASDIDRVMNDLKTAASFRLNSSAQPQGTQVLDAPWEYAICLERRTTCRSD